MLLRALLQEDGRKTSSPTLAARVVRLSWESEDLPDAPLVSRLLADLRAVRSRLEDASADRRAGEVHHVGGDAGNVEVLVRLGEALARGGGRAERLRRPGVRRSRVMSKAADASLNSRAGLGLTASAPRTLPDSNYIGLRRPRWDQMARCRTELLPPANHQPLLTVARGR
jgi:hypothetical protein